tara:strand:- start:431 stop:859 length:429 start_codon:yes stop_codon:yes gene_type:complete
MQRLRIQNIFNKETKSFDKSNFDIRETDKSISGKVSVSSKKGDVWVSKSIPFVVFKSKVDEDTQRTILLSKGQSFEADFGLIVDSFEADGKEIIYIKLVINKAVSINGNNQSSPEDRSSHDKSFAKVEEAFSDDIIDDDIPF